MILLPNILRIATHALFGEASLSHGGGALVSLQRRRAALDPPTRIHCLAISAIRLHAQMGQHVMAAPPFALDAQGGHVDGADDDLFAGAGVGLAENTAVVIDDHTAAGPAKGRIVMRA